MISSPRPAFPRRWRRVLVTAALLALCGYSGLYAHQSLPRSPADRLITTDSGVTLAYHVLRQTDDPTIRILLLHGAPADSGSWSRMRDTLDSLPAGCEVIAVDRPGYGYSDAAPEFSLAAQAQRLNPLITECTIVVGHSYGGPVALRAAIEFPDRVRGVVLVAGACDARMNDAQRLRRLIDSCSLLIPAPWARANRELLALTDENRRMTSQLAMLKCQVVIVHGTWDPVCPHDGTLEYLRDQITGAGELRVVSIPRAGHNLHLSHTALVGREIIQLVGQVTN